MKEIVEEMRSQLKNKYFVALLLVLGVAIFLRFKYAFGTGMWVDEGRYSRIGIEIADHILQYRVAEDWHGQITSYPPLYPYLIAFSSYIFGKTDFAVRVVSPLMAIAGIGVSYFMSREMKNRDIGIVVAALLTVNPVFWFMSEKILVGVTLMAVYTATIFALYIGFSDREDYYYGLWALGPLTALTLMTKQPAYTLGIVIPLYFVYRKRNELVELTGDVEFRKTEFYRTLMDRNYYIGVGLGLAFIGPWMLRNWAVCRFPMCGILKATQFASKTVNNPLADVGGTFYFIFSLPFIVTVPVALLIVFRVLQYFLYQADRDPDLLIKITAVFIAANTTSYFLVPQWFPLTLLMSIALFAKTDAEKLLWLWIGAGIGFMSVPDIKVPRYILFTVPALLTVGATGMHSIASWASRQVENEEVTVFRLMVLITIPILLISYMQGSAMASRTGFTAIEPAGEWIDANAPENSNIAATSPAQMRYFVYPRMAYKIPDNESALRKMILEKNIFFVEVDIYEQTQAEWVQTSIPPYRIPYSVRKAIQNGQYTQQQLQQLFSQGTPGYLVPVQSFGQTRMPLTKNQQQPAAVVYAVNRTALE
ncbi:MAG: ArnT family glycosyltransferase [Candidatus Nanohaloarchaea archaeon]